MAENSISNFLGVKGSSEGYVKPERYTSWMYDSPKIKYEFVLDKFAGTISISGDLSAPFSATSLYELCIDFDRAGIEKEEQFYGSRPILVFRKDYEDEKNFKCLMVMKWDDGELSVWPNNYDANQKNLKHWDD